MKKIAIALISIIICCVLVSCGEKGTTDTSGGDIAGEDWRTTGLVSDYGSITRGGVKTDILICVHKKDAAFYYDSPSQTLFGSAEYPIAVNDPPEAYRSTDFSDLNDDGNSDVRMTFEIGGDITVFAWLWDDKNDTFVFSEALSDSGTAEKQ